jgi:hypothetical protein
MGVVLNPQPSYTCGCVAGWEKNARNGSCGLQMHVILSLNFVFIDHLLLSKTLQFL